MVFTLPKMFKERKPAHEVLHTDEMKRRKIEKKNTQRPRASRIEKSGKVRKAVPSATSSESRADVVKKIKRDGAIAMGA